MIHETGAHAPILLPGVNSKIYVAILFATYWRIVTMNTVMHSYCTVHSYCDVQMETDAFPNPE